MDYHRGMKPSERVLNLRSQLVEQLPPFWQKLLERFLVLGLFSLLIMYVAPLGAAEETAPSPTESSAPAESPSPESSASIEPTAEPSPSPSPDPSNSDGDFAPANDGSDTSTVTEEDAPAPEPTPEPEPSALQPQPFIPVIAPDVLMVDPRAKSRFFPNIEIQAGNALLVCLLGHGVTIDIGQRFVPDSDGGLFSNVSVAGDMSSWVMITSDIPPFVAAAINQGGGIGVHAASGVTNKAVSIFAVAVSKPTLNPSICFQSASTRMTTLRALDLNLFIKKALVPLKKR